MKHRILKSLCALFFVFPLMAGAEVIGRWEFNNTLDDAVGQNNGHLAGGAPVFVEDRFGVDNRALLLKEGQHLDLGGNEFFSFSDQNGDKPFTMEWWQKCDVPETTAGRPGKIVNVIQKKGEYAVSWSHAFRLHLFSGDSYTGGHGPVALKTGTWTHIAVTYDGSGGPSGIRFYQDGMDKGLNRETRLEYRGMKPEGEPLILGSGFDGAIDGLAIYNRALSEEEIKDIAILSLAKQDASVENVNFNEYERLKAVDTDVISIELPLVKEAPELDADLSDEIWKNATWHRLDYGVFAERPENDTEFSLCHDQRNIYFAVKCHEPNPAGIKLTQTQHDSDVYRDDSVEVFIDSGSGGMRPVHYHLAINTNGTVFDEIAARNRTYADLSWNAYAQVRTKVLKDCWTVELSIPFSSMSFTANNPDFFRINLIRTRWKNNQAEREISSFSPVNSGHDSTNFAFAVVSGFPREFTAVTASLQKAYILPEGNQMKASFEMVFDNRSRQELPLCVSFDLTTDKDAAVKYEETLVLKPGRSSRTVPINTKPNKDCNLNVSVVNSRTGTLLLTRDYGVDLSYSFMETVLLQPWYMDAIFSGQDLDGFEWKVKINVHEDEKNQYRLRLELRDGNGKTIVSQLKDLIPSEIYKLDYPTEKLSLGEYQLSIAAEYKNDGEKLSEWRRRIRKLPPSPGQVTFSRNGTCLIDGKPFIPFGLADFGSTAFRIYRCKTAGFNTVHTLWVLTDDLLPGLDAFAKAGIKVSVHAYPNFPTMGTQRCLPRNLSSEEEKTVISYIDRYKTHSAILTWYTANEPEVGPESKRYYLPDAFRQINEIVNERDPYHPTHFLTPVNSPLKHYYQYTNVVGTDPYPFISAETDEWRNSEKVYRLVKDSLEVSDYRKPAWTMPSAFDWNQFRPDKKYRFPNFDDLRCQYFQAAIAGAKGFLWYARYWIIPEVTLGLKYIALENEMMKNAIAASPSPDEFSLRPRNPAIRTSCRKADGHVYLFTTNTSHEDQTYVMATGSDIKRLHVAGENRTVELRNGEFSDSFRCYGTHLYTNDEKVAETLDNAMKETLEAIRCSQNPIPKSGNLIALDKELKIDISLPMPTAKSGEVRQPPLQFMIDSNQYSWSTLNNGPSKTRQLPQSVQFEFSKEHVISKVVLDSNINELDVQIPDGEGWKTIGTSRSGDRSYRDSQVVTFEPTKVNTLRIVAESANTIAGLQDNQAIIWEVEAYK